MSEPKPGALPSDPREKALWCVTLLLYTFGCYYAIGHWQDPQQAHSLATPLDDWLPFRPVFMYAYVMIYTALFIPVFTVRCQRLFRRVTLSYFAAVTACLLIWLVYPVSALGLRPDVSGFVPTCFHEWGLRINYVMDPPLNLFPSLHVTIATLAALAAGKAKRAYGLLSGVLALLIIVSVSLVKQHFVSDTLAGLLLSFAAWAVFVRPYDPGEAAPEAVAYGWTGFLGYAVMQAGVLAGFYSLYLAGFTPWER